MFALQKAVSLQMFLGDNCRCLWESYGYYYVNGVGVGVGVDVDVDVDVVVNAFQIFPDN